MKEQLLKLVDLQNVDYQIYDINKKLEKLPEELKKLQDEFHPQKEKYETLDKSLKEKEALNLQYQADLKGHEEKLKSLQKRLSEVKNAKELNAVDTEINTVKKTISEIEEIDVKLLDEIENLKKEISESQHIIQEEDKHIKEIEAQIEKENKESEEKLSVLKQERKKLLNNISPELLKEYEFIFEKREGKAIVAVKDSVCTGCYMSIPPQTINDIRKGLSIYKCQYCSRILFYPEWEN